MKTLRRPVPHPHRPRGSAAVPFALILPVVLGMMGLAIDLSVVYLRRTELQQMADSTAMAAARRLDGTLAGIAAAKQDANFMAHRNYYAGIYSGSPTLFEEGTSWSTTALFFGKLPDGPWLPADSVTDATTASKMIYAKVDTAELAGLSAHPNTVNTTLMRFVGAPRAVTVSPVAVAGKTGMQVTPLGICALNNDKFTPHPSSVGDELVEFGYRRGVPYDLLNLNPKGAAPQNYLINPIDDGEVASPASAHVTHDYVKPFFCSGSIAFASLRSGKTVHVAERPDIHDWLNSRFEDYTGDGDACPARNGAPPDTNIKEFTPASVSWIKSSPPDPGPLLPSAKPYKTSTALVTIADPTILPSDVRVKDYGPLWVNAKPVQFVSDTEGGGSTPVPFSLGNWPDLYRSKPGETIVVPNILTYKYPPYANNKQAPSSGIAIAGRRMLNVPLLDCSGSISGTATVLGIGKFLMIAKATSGSVYAEFNGLVSESELVSNVRRAK